MNRLHIVLIASIVIIASLASYFYFRFDGSRPLITPSPSPTVSVTLSPSPLTSKSKTQSIKASDIGNADADYAFTATVPASWKVEAVTAIDSINFYDPVTTGDTTLEKSQVFVRKFSANQFLTLSTVTIHDRRELTIANRPAVRYDIQKKADVANFPNQPSWRNERHVVTDVRVSDANPSVFYVIAKRPDLDEATYQQILDSLALGETEPTSLLIPPTDDFENRITKKKFGQFITKQNSPVQPERFSGYHTGVDVEFTDSTGEIGVKAIADGTVLHSGTVSGYGGVLALSHTIDGQSFVVVYGHLNPTSVKPKGSTVKRGDQIAVLGDDKSTETDGERKHLHLAFVKGSTVDLKGYVQTQAELDAWADPLTYYSF